MELITKNVYKMERKCQAVNQISFDEDLNVPDIKPDIGRMIQKKGEIQMEDIQIQQGMACLTGDFCVQLLYVSDGAERKICSLYGTLPIHENMNLEGLEHGDKVQVKWDVEDLNIQIINSRKINIKALVSFMAYVEELSSIEVPLGLENSEISQKKEEYTLISTAVHKKDVLRIKEEVLLSSEKPDIYELLWDTIEIRGIDIRAEKDKIGIRGEVFLFALYRGREEHAPLQWLEHVVPFYQEMECMGCTPDMIPNVEITMAQSELKGKADEDGEERILSAEATLELEIQIFEEEKISLLTDVYTPSKECRTVRKRRNLEGLLVKNCSKCKVNDRVRIENPQGRILQICHSDGMIKVNHTKIEKNGILVKGIAKVRILYIIGDDEMPFYSTETMIPFAHKIEAEGITENAGYHLRTDLEQLSTTMIDSDEIEVKIGINLNALVVERKNVNLIRSVEEEELDREKLRNMPGIVGYQVQPGDTLWDIAKKFYTTKDDIIQINGLENENIKPYDNLILVKKVEK